MLYLQVMFVVWLCGNMIVDMLNESCEVLMMIDDIVVVILKCCSFEFILFRTMMLMCGGVIADCGQG